uniref:DUF3741 domain-containing protein n=2 Tax=Cucumis melo TaxID=3656 RepID=A0A9I9E9L5_CUCME
MKRQNSFLSSSSSSQLQISSDNLLRHSHSRRSRSFGCVSSLLHFLSNSHKRRNKSITFVHNSIHELDDTISVSKTSPSPKHDSAANLLFFSSDSSRIAERSDSTMSTTTVERFRGARGPIVRLMGLESSTAVEEKQRQVMEALEKCERDLKALKEFIDAFESTESFRSLSPAGEGKRIELMVLKQQEEGSPVAEELSWPWHLLNRHGFNNSMIFHRPSANSGRIQSQKIQQMQRKKQEDQEDHMMMLNTVSKFDRTKNKTHEIVIGNWKLSEKAKELSPSLCRSNKVAMRESVEEVFKDIFWGQKKELGRIGLTLQNQICGDLIEELVKDLNFSFTFTYYTSLPFQACKRSLCF